MKTANLLVVYGTTYGQTGKIAHRMAERLTGRGHIVTLLNGDALPAGLTARDFDGVIVGASIVRGRHQLCIDGFVRRDRAALNRTPSAFFSVSGSAASQHATERAKAELLLEEFLEAAGWRPKMTCNIGGAMTYTKYNLLLRWMMKWISRRNGGPTDTSRDHELTNWQDVERFVDDFEALVRLPERQLLSAPA